MQTGGRLPVGGVGGRDLPAPPPRPQAPYLRRAPMVAAQRWPACPAPAAAVNATLTECVGGGILRDVDTPKTPRKSRTSASPGGGDRTVPAHQAATPPNAPRRRVTLIDVATAAGVSTSTVSRALDNHPRIPAATRRRVREAADALGFQPNISARSLRTQSSMVVGVVVPDVGIAFYATVLKAAQNVLEGAGYQVMVMNTERDAQHETAALRTLYARQVDGVLVTTSGGFVPERVPAVFLDHVLLNAGVGYTAPDNAGGIRILVEHLVHAHGHERVAYLGAPLGPSKHVARLEHSPATERFEAFRDTMGSLRLPVVPQYLAVADYEWSELSAERAVTDLLTQAEPPTAIVAASDTLALGALRGLRRAGKIVPTDVALVSFDDPVSSDLLDPPMTALARHDRELGETAARMLLAVLRGGEPHSGEPVAAFRVPLELIVRRSCGCPVPPQEKKL
jgi:LacI family transcriptional regulator